MEPEQDQEGPALRSGDLERPTVAADNERSEQSQFHVSPRDDVSRRYRPGCGLGSAPPRKRV